ncbi:MAG TPA: RNA polymerase sigma-54 factor [Ruminococcaceae bacterium]|nr:RNA polymerase sigma-54 factor [Oscillospiraceae bacterium]
MIAMKLNLNVDQKLILYPKMEQSLKILGMDSTELEMYVQQLSEENPTLDVEPRENEVFTKKSSAEKTYDGDTYRSDIYGTNQNEEDESDMFAQISSPELGFQELLIRQLRLQPATDEEYRAGAYIIGCLDRNGYLKIGVNKIANLTGYSIEIVHKGLGMVQSLDPAGVGARTLSECLILQLRRNGQLTDLLQNVIERYLPQLGQGHFLQVASKLKQNPEMIKHCYNSIRKLNPKPCASLGYDHEVSFIKPDICVLNQKGKFASSIYDSLIPRINVRRDYLSMLNSSPDRETVSFISKKINEAEWVVDAIKRRNRTMFAVTCAIIELQSEFFNKGPRYLAPMTLSDIAEKVNMHPSTISRVASRKYLQCDFGLYPIRYFFSQGITKENEKTVVSAVGIKAREIFCDLNRLIILSSQQSAIRPSTLA